MTHKLKDEPVKIIARVWGSEQNWLITISLVILAVVALGATLMYTRAVMIPFVVALFIVALVSPIEDFQVRWLHLPRIIAVIVTLLVVLAVMAVLSLFVVQAIRTIASTAGEYSSNFEKMADKLLAPVEYIYGQEEAQLAPGTDQAQYGPQQAQTPAPTPRVDANAVASKPPEPQGLAQRFQRINTRQIIKDLTDNARQSIKDMTNRMFNILTNTVGTIFGLLSGTLVVFMFVIFLLAGRNPHAGHSQIYVEVVQKIRRYLGTKVIISALVGVLVWASLAIIGLKLAGVFGVLAFVVNFIPVIGPIIVTVLPLPLALAQFQSPWPIILVVVVPGTLHNVIGNIIEPKLMGEGLDLHPVTILLALSFWGMLWGIMGTFLATPITAVVRIVLMQFDTFRPIANLLAGDFTRPAAGVNAPAGSASARSEGTEPAGVPRG